MKRQVFLIFFKIKLRKDKINIVHPQKNIFTAVQKNPFEKGNMFLCFIQGKF